MYCTCEHALCAQLNAYARNYAAHVAPAAAQQYVLVSAAASSRHPEIVRCYQNSVYWSQDTPSLAEGITDPGTLYCAMHLKGRASKECWVVCFRSRNSPHDDWGGVRVFLAEKRPSYVRVA